MRFTRFSATFAALMAVTALSACDGKDVSIDRGKPLSDLDLSGPAPNALALYGPDEVNIQPGDKLAISVAGDQAAASDLRFSLKGNTLGINRRSGSNAQGTAVVSVTMPPPGKLVAAGSGILRSSALANEADVTLAGSGKIETMNVAADRLKVTIAGSGDYRAAGTADTLELDIAGSGNAAMENLKAGSARIRIAGSGGSTFSSDGEVSANILGSGKVTVRGRAHCKVTAVGSGKLVCEAVEPA